MGSWNETDLLTQLPINSNDRVRWLLLGNRQCNVYSETDINHGKIETSGRGMTNSEELWSPILPPISASYDDYGGVDKIEVGVEKVMLLSFLNENFIYSDPEEYNRVEDYEVGKNTQTLPVYLRSIERGYGCYNSFQGARVLGYTMILEDVYQEIMKYNPIVMHSDWSDKKNPIHLYMHWQESVQLKLEKWYSATYNVWIKFNRIKNEIERKQVAHELFMISESHRVFDNYKSLSASEFHKILTNKARQEIPITDSTVKYIIKAFKELLLLNGFMDATRKFYTPQCGKGSQDSELEPYILLAKCINDIAQNEIKLTKKKAL